MKKDYSPQIKKVPYFVLLLATIYLSIVLISYNSPDKVDSKLSGIFIDYDSAMRGVSVDKIHIDSIDDIDDSIIYIEALSTSQCAWGSLQNKE